MRKLFIAALGATLLYGTAAYSQTAVKIGVLSDFSGPYADFSGEGSAVATRMAAEEFMAQNKDVTVEVISADHLNKPDIGAAIARKWFDEEGVDAVVDLTSSGVAFAVNDIVREKNKVFLGTGSAPSDLTGKACSPNTVHWTYDTYSTSHGTGSALMKAGMDTWFFITADYAFGHALERDTTAVVTEMGGKVLGGVKPPINNSDFSSFLLQAQASGAKVIGLANAGGDMINTVKQAGEFGITDGGTKIAALLTFITDVNSLGLKTAQGLVLTEAYYWDLNDNTRAFAKRFAEKMPGRVPSQSHAGAYAATLHYLKAVAALKSKDGKAVVDQMKKTRTSDVAFGEGYIREDGRKMHPVYLFEVKSPAESKGPWDYYKLVAEIPAEQAFRPISKGGCPLVKL